MVSENHNAAHSTSPGISSPTNAYPTELIRQSRVIHNGALVLLCCVPLYTAFFLLFGAGFTLPTLTILGSGVAALPVFPLTKRRRYLTLLGNYVIAILWVVLFNVGWYTGGYAASTMYWIPAVPLIALLFVGWRSAFVWGGVAVGHVCFFFWISHLGYRLPQIFSQSTMILFVTFSQGMLTVVLLVMGLVFKNAKDRALERERKRQLELVESERRFQDIAETIPGWIWELDAEGRYTYVSQGVQKSLGYTSSELLGKTPYLLMPPEEVQAKKTEREQVVARRGQITNHLGIYLTNQGAQRYIETSGVPILDREGDLVGYRGIDRDVTERLHTEEILERSEASFRALIEQSPDAIAVYRHGRFIYVNRTFLRLLHYEHPDDLIGREVIEVLHPDDLETVVHRIDEMTQKGFPVPSLEGRLIGKDGNVVTTEFEALQVLFNGESAIVAIGRDISERRKLIAHIMQIDRMAAVGTLAAGVAHEINNPLAYTLSNVDFALAQLKEAARGQYSLDDDNALDLSSAVGNAESALEEALEGALRVRSVVADLKTFFRPGEDELNAVDLQSVIDSAINLAQNEIKHRARLVRDYQQIPEVEGNTSRLGQVFLNLLVNAAQAIPEGAIEKNKIMVRTLLDGDKVIAEVKDTGCGIPADQLNRIFDPFYTTKPVGQGTGLGLSICRRITQAHGIDFKVQSEEGRGTTFQLVFCKTASDKAASVEESITEEPEIQAPAHAARILVVDDEPLIGRSLDRMLGSEHRVVVATSGEKALEHIRLDQPYDIVFCDLMMPEMTGMDLYRELARLSPQTASRVIFMTGGAFTPRARSFMDSVPNHCINKPFEANHINALVYEMIENHGYEKKEKPAQEGG